MVALSGGDLAARPLGGMLHEMLHEMRGKAHPLAHKGRWLMSAFGATYGIDDIAELVSPRVAMRLVEAFPGTVRYIPKKIGDDHELLVIGAAEAAALAQQFGGAHITIPMSFITPARRRALIFRLAAENIPRQEIALRAECTERRVYQILHEGPKPPLQSSLKFSD